MELLFLLFCRNNLDFSIPDFQYYSSIGLSALDATFSARTKYSSVINVVHRFCEHYDLPYGLDGNVPEVVSQIPVSQLLDLLQGVTPAELADIVHNHSQTGGRLKASLFLDALNTLQRFGIENYQDFQKQMNNLELEAALSALQGMGEATLSYFYMLSGDSGDVKVDQHIRAFTSTATGVPNLTVDQIKRLFRYAAQEMTANDHLGMTARQLDHIVWVYQRNL